MKSHYDGDSYPAYSIVLLLKGLLKVCCWSNLLHFSHIYFQNTNIYDDIKIIHLQCFKSALRRVSTNISDNPRITKHIGAYFISHHS